MAIEDKRHMQSRDSSFYFSDFFIQFTEFPHLNYFKRELVLKNLM